jgi:hypothetical protein
VTPAEPVEPAEHPCDEMPEWRLDDDAIDRFAQMLGE